MCYWPLVQYVVRTKYHVRTTKSSFLKDILCVPNTSPDKQDHNVEERMKIYFHQFANEVYLVSWVALFF